MAEKRKQPPRAGREPAKRRATEAAATPTSHRKKEKEKAPTPKAPSPPTEPIEAPLPVAIKEGDPLPVRKSRQPTNLPDEDYQSIAERFVAITTLKDKPD